MKGKKQSIDATVALTKANCYYMNTGRCSLDLVSDFYINPAEKIAPSDLLYCPRLYKALCGKEKCKPVGLTVCACGHADVTSGQPAACIASQKGLELPVVPDKDDAEHKLCDICGGQQTLDSADERGKRLMPLRVVVVKDT